MRHAAVSRTSHESSAEASRHTKCQQLGEVVEFSTVDGYVSSRGAKLDGSFDARVVETPSIRRELPQVPSRPRRRGLRSTAKLPAESLSRRERNTEQTEPGTWHSTCSGLERRSQWRPHYMRPTWLHRSRGFGPDRLQRYRGCGARLCKGSCRPSGSVSASGSLFSDPYDVASDTPELAVRVAPERGRRALKEAWTPCGNDWTRMRRRSVERVPLSMG
jgi:hypothetical protein